jgi:hypothetical protein
MRKEGLGRGKRKELLTQATETSSDTPTLSMKFSAAAALILATSAHASPMEDLVTSLPGVDGDLPFGMYSGFLDYELDGVSVHTHYILTEQATPASDASPLIFWSNGGPGASSMFGFTSEVGPFNINAESMLTDPPTLFVNPTGWNNLGDLLIFEAPAPVGFSYCGDDVSGPGTSCGDWTDERASRNNYLALQAFYAKFPEKLPKPLYLSGESYAGVYIPTMAREILEGDATINLAGFAVGDACTGTEVLCGDTGQGPWWDLTFMYGHGQFSTKTYDSIIATCTEKLLKHPGEEGLNDDCNALLSKMDEEIGGYYDYGLYDDCTYQNGLMKRRHLSHLQWRSSGPDAADAAPGGALNDYSCGSGEAMEYYVTIPAVRDALHVDQDSNFFSGDNGVGFNYTLTEANLIPFYNDVAVGKFADRNVRVMVYNGDTDPGINSFVAQNWTTHVGLDEVESWRPWTIDACLRMGGYITRYEGDFQFATIRGAGVRAREKSETREERDEDFSFLFLLLLFVHICANILSPSSTWSPHTSQTPCTSCSARGSRTRT